MRTKYREMKLNVVLQEYKPFVLRLCGLFLLMMVGVNGAWGQTEITSLSQIQASGNYIIKDNIDATGLSESIASFSGTLTAQAKSDGTFPVITGLSVPLFTTATNATISNIILQGVSINGSSDNIGAIACVADGYTRIYNCGILPNDATFPEGTHPSVSTSGSCAGSLVGKLDGDSRVVNCFSYADVSSGSTAAGIVGNNTYASNAAVSGGKYTKLKTMVVNCMYYGNISATTIYPVYGGQKISNNNANGINNYNFYSVGCTFSTTLADYNCSWPAQLDYLTRYEFHRNLLNSNRELCGWWVGAPSAPSTMSTTDVQAVPKDASLIAKWVLDRSVAPYPILKPFGKYASPVNIDADASWRMTANEWEGKKLGTLDVTVNGGAHHSGSESLELTITDMDTLRADYCYKKVQLPYYNSVFGNPNGSTWAEKYGGNYGDYVVIGWKVSTSEGTTGTLTENWQDGYNFADRNCTAKDANRVFAQGGYYYVPEGVTSITITAQWAQATYFDNSNHSYDRVYMSNSKAGTHFAPAGYRPTTLGNGKTVSADNLKNLANASTGDVFNRAVVLVGNHQYRHDTDEIGSNTNTTGYGFTVMSSDFDFDEEPDHCLIWQLGKKYERHAFCPIRFDFLPVVEIGLAMKQDGSKQYYSLGCYRPLGHFEVTETSLIHFGQFEFSNLNRKLYAPLILNAGIYDQYTKGTRGNAFTTADDKINYIIIGGNVRMPSFTPGAHVNENANYPTRHCAVNVIGGNIDKLYLTGNYNESVTPNQDNPHCYIDGGRIKQVAAAGKEGINGDVYFKINHSKIWEFYGGSTMDKSDGNNFKIVKGNIDVTIDNSIVDKYCGGPKFGNMIYNESNPANSKTITTNANNTTFGVYYGGGNGGTSYVQYDKTDVTGDYGVSTGNYNWNGTGNNQGHLDNYNAGKYRSTDHNYMADYDTEIINVSTGTESGQAVCRTYFYAAQFSATNTGPVTNNLTNCTVLTNFYGGGNLGGVKGSVTSTLTGTQVNGSAFGGGFSATIPDVTIYNKDKIPASIDINTGIVTPQSGGTSTTYTWTHETSLGGQTLSTSNPAALNVDGKNYYYTEISLDNLGTVTGTVTLNIEEGTTVTGSVFGGGEMSGVGGSVIVNIEGGEIQKDVYGGGALADTNTGSTSNTTKVNLKGGTIYGDAYGGGLGRLASGTEGNSGYLAPVAAMVNGNVTVTLNGTVFVSSNTTTDDEDNIIPASGRIFGCNNLNGTPKGTVLVKVLKTVPANGTRAKGAYEVQAVYGGGNLAPYDPTNPEADGQYAEGGHTATKKPVQVVIDGCGDTSIEYVYGGGNAAPVPATDVLILGSYEIGNVFGGGNGKDKYSLDGGTTWLPNNGADVGIKNATHDTQGMATSGDNYGTGEALTTILGGTIHAIYGGSNTKGDIVTKAEVVMGDENLEYCVFEIGEVYGGGNEAYLSGTAGMTMKCIEGIDDIYGGSRNADVGSDIILNISGGHYNRVFGGNNEGGTIHGTITVNIEEKGCLPITIIELYGGGNDARYSVEDIRATRKSTLGDNYINYPQVNIISATNIGTIFGGGLGEHAIVTGNPHVNINMEKGTVDGKYEYKEGTSPEEYSGYGEAQELPLGKIGTVFGGGNAAKVNGNTYVNIGDATFVDENCVEVEITRNKAIITDNVYGGGNKADVTGKTNVVIGQ